MYQNLMMQAINLNLENPDAEIRRVLRIVRMEENAQLKFKKCPLGMKQRIGIAMALLGDQALLILDEPINGLDTEAIVDCLMRSGCTPREVRKNRIGLEEYYIELMSRKEMIRLKHSSLSAIPKRAQKTGPAQSGLKKLKM